MSDVQLDSGTADLPSGGSEQVSENFDMSQAVDSIGESLGFGVGEVVDEVVKPAVETPAATVAPTTPAEPVVTAPKTWKPEEVADWANIPASAKAAIARREEEMFKGIEQYKNTASFGTNVQSVLQPYEQILKQYGIDPVQNISGLMQTQYTLAKGTQEQKEALFANMAKEYGINLGQVSSANTDAYTDPQVKMLQDEIASLKAGQSSLHQARYEEVKSKTQNEVNAFAANPENSHFDFLADDITKLLLADKQMTLQKAYETAVWTNPVTRAKEVEKQATAAQAKAKEEAEKKLAGIKRATAANVQVQPKAGAATLPLGTMDDTMAATLASIKNRSN